MGHGSRRARRAHRSSGAQPKRRRRIHVGSNGSPVRDGSLESVVQTDDSGEGGCPVPTHSHTPVLEKGEEPPQLLASPNLTTSHVPCLPSSIVPSTSDANVNTQAMLKATEAERADHRGPRIDRQSPKDTEFWQEHFARCLGSIPGLERFSTGAQGFAPGDLTPPSSDEKLGFRQDESHLDGKAFPQTRCQPDHLNSGSSEEAVRSEWQSLLIPNVFERARDDRKPKHSRFFNRGTNTPDVGESSLPSAEYPENHDLFWETATRESKLLYAGPLECSPKGGPSLPNDKLTIVSERPAEGVADGNEAERSHVPDTDWTVLQLEEVKSALCESPHMAMNGSRDMQPQSDALCEEWELPRSEDCQELEESSSTILKKE